MWRGLVLFSVLAVARAQESTAVTQCIRNQGELPINTHIVGCVTPPCRLPQLQDVVLNIVFRAPHTMRTMRTLVTAYLSILPIPYDLGENALTCNFLVNSYCPVIRDEILFYTLKMYIEPIFPVNTAVTLEFRVVDDTNNPVVCIRVPIRIDPPVESREANATMITIEAN